MSEWREGVLGELLAIKHGYAFKGAAFSQGGASRLVTPGNFYERGGFRDRGPTQKSYDGPVPYEYVLEPDSLVVAMTEQAPGLLGSSGLVPRDHNTWLHNQRIGLVRVRDGAANLRFLYYLFNDPSVRAQISASATGTKVRHTAPRRIQAVKAPIPDIATQSRIAAILFAFDELIKINERRVELLEGLARSLYREWFERFRFPGHEDAELVNSELGFIPEAWKVSPFAEVGAFLNGFAFKPAHHEDHGLPVIKIRELKNGVTPSTPRYGGLDLDPKYFIDPGDLLFSWSADLGVYLWSGEKAVLNQHLFSVLPKEGMTREFLFQALRLFVWKSSLRWVDDEACAAEVDERDQRLG